MVSEQDECEDEKSDTFSILWSFPLEGIFISQALFIFRMKLFKNDFNMSYTLYIKVSNLSIFSC